MTRDTRKRSNQAHRHPSSGQSLPGWVWGISGLAAGLFVALLVYLHQPAPSGPAAVSSLFRPHPTANAGAVAKPDGTTSTPAEEPTHPRFEFYKLLPKQEVEVPTPGSASTSSTSRQTPAVESKSTDQPQQLHRVEAPQQEHPQAGSSSGYLLQVGSFRHFSDADQLKANLALLGIEASIQSVELADGETWHRVRIGPFSDRQHLDEIRKQLQVNNIHTIVLKRGG